jgi:hypothetical protein
MHSSKYDVRDRSDAGTSCRLDTVNANRRNPTFASELSEKAQPVWNREGGGGTGKLVRGLSSYARAKLFTKMW